jgi:hypothetical protein
MDAALQGHRTFIPAAKIGRHPCERGANARIHSCPPFSRWPARPQGHEGEAGVSRRVAALDESFDFADARERRELLRYVAKMKSLIALSADPQPFDQQR